MTCPLFRASIVYPRVVVWPQEPSRLEIPPQFPSTISNTCPTSGLLGNHVDQKPCSTNECTLPSCIGGVHRTQTHASHPKIQCSLGHRSHRLYPIVCSSGSGKRCDMKIRMFPAYYIKSQGKITHLKPSKGLWVCVSQKPGTPSAWFRKFWTMQSGDRSTPTTPQK
jgi:hypothetical protein